MKNFLAAAVTGILVLGAMPASALDLVQNFENYQINTQTRVPPSPQEVREAIIAAGSALNWRFADEGPARLRGTLVVRNRHTVEVAIPYSADRFSVLYTGSDNMRYDPGTRMIHPNYNVWARQLVDRIAGQLSSLAPQAAPARHIITAQGLARPASDGDALVEVSFWESVRGSSNPAELQAYLDQYPNGKFGILARARLSSLGVAPRLAPAPAASAPAVAPIAAVAAVAPAAASPGSRYPAPGDTWTYRLIEPNRTDGPKQRSYTVTVEQASAKAIVDQFSIQGGASGRTEHPSGLYLVADAAPVFSPYLPVFESISPKSRFGRVLLLHGACGRDYRCDARVRVLGEEKISVPAGTFETVKLLVDHSWQWASPVAYRTAQFAGARRLTVWYAPAVKRAIKYSSRLSFGAAGPVEAHFDAELDSYKLN